MIGFHIPLLKNAFESIRFHHERTHIREFQLFLKNPRQMKLVKCKEQESKLCKDYIQEHHIFVVTHASYLLNMANPDKWDEKIQSAKNEIDLAEHIGAKGSVFHLGKHLKLSVSQGEDYMYQFVKTIIDYIQDQNYQTKMILETSARCGTELCWNIQDFGRFFHRFTTEEKMRLGICIDTCHVFSAGYPIHTDAGCEDFIRLVDENIGWNHVTVIHLNDSLSLTGCGCKLDRHANIMGGFIRDGMKRLIRHTLDLQIPHILETPYEEDKIFETHLKEIDEIEKWFV